MLGYYAIHAPDPGRAKEFYHAVLGWSFFYFVQPVADDDAKNFHTALLGWKLTPGTHENGYNIVDIAPPGGLFVSRPGPADLYFQVADIADATDRVRAAGGTAGPVQPNQAGSHAACRDDQGIAFSIGSLHDT